MALWLAMLVAFFISLAGCLYLSRSKSVSNFSNVIPVENRWHQEATPGLGGIAIFIAFTALVMLANPNSLGTYFLVSSLPLLALGVYDDLKPVTPRIKIVVQLVCVLIMIAFIAPYISYPESKLVATLSQSGFSPAALLHFTLCGFWLVFIINAINLLDNMDGLCGGVSLIITLTIALIANDLYANANVSWLFLLLASSIAGFLVLNHHPAKLFMGDAGTLWIGLLIGAGTLLVASNGFKTGVGDSSLAYVNFWLIPVLLCALPISDTLMVMTTRKLRGQAVSVGGQDHLSHRLVSLGLSQPFSVGILWLITLVSSLLSLLVYSYPLAIWIAPVSAFLILLFSGTVWLVRRTSSSSAVAVVNFRQHD